MEQDEFDARVRKLNAASETSPGWYRLRVGAFALFGYGVYLGILLLSLGIVAGMGALMIFKPSLWILKFGWKLGIPLLIFVVAMLRALKVTVPVPQGLAVTRQQAPALYELIDRVSAQLRVPELRAVLLTDEYNASVVQLPRFGLLGNSSYLMLGMPLLQALSKEDMTAVLAHEFGHLSGNHGRFGGFVYRAVQSYVRVLETTGDNKLLVKFLNWYVPRLDALSFPLRRQNEYEADAASAEVIGKQRAGQALTNVHVRGALEDEFWAAVGAKVHDTPHPPADLFVDWESRVRQQPARSAEQALVEAMQETTGTSDTHPSLADRLKILGVEPGLEPAPELSAARELLGDSHDFFVTQAGFHWSARVHEGWKERHESLGQSRQRLEGLEKVRAAGALSAAQAFEYAKLAEELDDDRDPLPLYQAVLELDAAHLGARFNAARLLIARGHEAGVALISEFEQARDHDLRMAASALLAEYHASCGDEKAAEASMARARDAHAAGREIDRAREELTVEDVFAPHALGPEALAQLKEDLAMFPAIRRAYVVRKVVESTPDAFVVAIELTLKHRMIDDETLVQRLIDTLTLPGQSWCIRLDQNPRFEKPLKAVAGSLVYET